MITVDDKIEFRFEDQFEVVDENRDKVRQENALYTLIIQAFTFSVVHVICMYHKMGIQSFIFHSKENGVLHTHFQPSPDTSTNDVTSQHLIFSKF